MWWAVLGQGVVVNRVVELRTEQHLHLVLHFPLHLLVEVLLPPRLERPAADQVGQQVLVPHHVVHLVADGAALAAPQVLAAVEVAAQVHVQRLVDGGGQSRLGLRQLRLVAVQLLEGAVIEVVRQDVRDLPGYQL